MTSDAAGSRRQLLIPNVSGFFFRQLERREELPEDELSQTLETFLGTVTLPPNTGLPPFSGPALGEPTQSDASSAAAVAALCAVQALGETVFRGTLPADPELRSAVEDAAAGRRQPLPPPVADSARSAEAAAAAGALALAASAEGRSQHAPPWEHGTLVQFTFSAMLQHGATGSGDESSAESSGQERRSFAAVELGYGGACG